MPLCGSSSCGCAIITDGTIFITGSGAVRDPYELSVGVPRLSYTPVVTAVTTDPDLGVGGAVYGYFFVVGGLCTVWVRVQFGSSGVVAGSGTYFVSLPVAEIGVLGVSATARIGQVLGTWHGDNASGSPAGKGGEVQLVDTSKVEMPWSDDFVMSNSSPWTWAANDSFSLMFSYPVT